jgi:hypothetical protein
LPAESSEWKQQDNKNGLLYLIVAVIFGGENYQIKRVTAK